MIQNIIFDFDSTIVDAEGIELLVKAGLKRIAPSERKAKHQRLKQLTQQAMEGQIPLSFALQERLKLAAISKQDVQEVAAIIRNKVNPLVKDTIQILQQAGKNLFIFSGGFQQLVEPVAERLGISPQNVFGNRLIFEQNGLVCGIDENNPLFLSCGKVYLAERLKSQGVLQGSTAIVGDGANDLAIRKINVAQMFVYFGGTVRRPEIKEAADFFVERFDQLVPLFCSTSELAQTPQAMIQPEFEVEHVPYRPSEEELCIALLEDIHPSAIRKLSRLSPKLSIFKELRSDVELKSSLAQAHVLGIRSKIKLSAKTISKVPHLLAIGAFCIGTDQIDLSAATNQGIPVFNAPYSNTRSVAELVVGEIIMLMRKVIEKNNAAHQGEWLKTAEGCFEVRGKTVGIIGYGHIGSQVSVLLENLGMRVIYYDIVEKLPLGNAHSVKTLNELLSSADVITLHVPDTPKTRNMISTPQLAAVKKGSILINASRGTVVDLHALEQAIQSGRLRGAALDVFPSEPKGANEKFVCNLQGYPNVMLTPHVGGSTQEAQERIGIEVSEKLIQFIEMGTTMGAVNFPQVQLPRRPQTHRILHIHRNVPGVLAKVNNIFSQRGINIESQILETKGNIGYLIVDVNRDISDQVFNLLARSGETIKARKIT